MRARLYLDEDLVPELARILRARGHDIVSAHEVGAVGLDDEDQLIRASADGRAILTCNFLDFRPIGERWFLEGRPHAGIIISYRRYSRRQLGEFARVVTALLANRTAEDLQDSVQILDQFRF